jgi:1-phosphatidylinositol-4-phosphate 5-kinase
MIKTQTKNESKFLRRILPHYYKFVMENPNTLITRFYGMHRVKMHHLRRKMHFIIMASVFDTPLEIHRRFDLKGSRVGRRASSKEKANNGVLKDMDLLESDFRLQMGAELRAMLLVQIRKDVEFLKRMKIMDYSLLIGVHNSRQVVHTNDGIATNLNGSPRNDSPHAGSLTSPAKSPIISGECVSSYSRQQGDSSPCERSMSKETTNIPDIVLPPTQLCRSCSLPERSNTVMESEALNRFSEGTAELDFDFDSESESEHSSNEEFVEFSPSIEPLSPRVLDVEKYPGHSESIFCHDEGGIYGRDRYGRKNGYVYFLGVIDILQQYNSRKIAETFFKGFRHNRKQISAVNPNFYGDRFIEFVEKNVVLDDTLPIHD